MVSRCSLRACPHDRKCVDIGDALDSRSQAGAPGSVSPDSDSGQDPSLCVTGVFSLRLSALLPVCAPQSPSPQDTKHRHIAVSWSGAPGPNTTALSPQLQMKGGGGVGGGT